MMRGQMKGAEEGFAGLEQRHAGHLCTHIYQQ